MSVSPKSSSNCANLALKVANREAENSRLRAALGMVAEEQQNVASKEEASTEEE